MKYIFAGLDVLVFMIGFYLIVVPFQLLWHLNPKKVDKWGDWHGREYRDYCGGPLIRISDKSPIDTYKRFLD